MCGVLGHIDLNTQVGFAPRFRAALDLQVHRGPDDSGIANPAPGVWLGHRRLSIIDLSPAGHQPMSNETGDLWVVFNGEIYNFLELRPELEAAGHRFSSHTDTEVLLHGYEEWGLDGLLPRLKGMFAFALYDRERSRLVLVRDRLGVKPLYFHHAAGSLTFASEIKSILHLRPELRCLNPQAVSSFLSYRMVLGDETFFQGITALTPGSLLVWEKGQAARRRYWQIPDGSAPDDLGEAAYVEQTRHQVLRATQRRLISDVPLGAYLSGGLDSSLLVAAMSRLGANPVKTFSTGFQDADFNEFAYARQVRDRYQTAHHEIVLQSGKFFSAVPDVIRFKDGPLGVQNEVALHLMSRELKRHITVVMSGEGADEMFGGYGRIFSSPHDWQRWQDAAFREAHPGFESSFRQRYPDPPATELDHFLSLYGWLDAGEKKELLNPDFNAALQGDAALRNFWQERFTRYNRLSPYDRYMRVFQEVHLQGLLYRLDTATMGASVESRNPFVDHELVEFTATIPWWHKMKWRSEADRRAAQELTSDQYSERHDITKSVLREAFAADLPADVVNRRKMGFPVPLHRWFGGEERQLLKQILLDPRCRQRGIFDCDRIETWLADDARFESHAFGLKIWMLLNVEWFSQIYDL
jgi:asparagine synthase (glutamine-hydrolysing)